jgi:hypothetical protein
MDKHVMRINNGLTAERLASLETKEWVAGALGHQRQVQHTILLKQLSNWLLSQSDMILSSHVSNLISISYQSNLSLSWHM